MNESIFPGVRVIGLVGCHLLLRKKFSSHISRVDLVFSSQMMCKKTFLMKHLAKRFDSPNLLQTRIIKFKYKTTNAIQQLKQPRTFSWAWWAISGTIDILKEGCKWFVVDGQCICILNYPWIFELSLVADNVMFDTSIIDPDPKPGTLLYLIGTRIRSSLVLPSSPYELRVSHLF